MLAASAPPLRPLNLLVVTVDTLRPDHLHCYGYSKIETPNMDAIALHGALFENAVTQTPLTPPSHASIFTGLNPPSHHVRDTGGFVLQPSSTTLATILQRQGWDTAAFISSAVLKKLFGLNQGFAVYDDQMPRPGKGHEFDEDAERRAGETVDHALHWLDAQSGKPFFLWVHIYDPHAPYQPPAPYREKYKDRLYDGEIAYADHELGRLFDAVRQKSPDKTLIAVLSDHGESLGEHGEYTHGVFLYDSTLRIAFVLSGPGVPAGARIRQQARTIDFLPTMLDLMGGKPPATVEGVSLTPYFAGKDRSYGGLLRRNAVSQNQHGLGRVARHPHEPLEVYPRAEAGALRSLPGPRGSAQRDPKQRPGSPEIRSEPEGGDRRRRHRKSRD